MILYKAWKHPLRLLGKCWSFVMAKKGKRGWTSTIVSFDLIVQHNVMWIGREEMINKMRIL